MVFVPEQPCPGASVLLHPEPSTGREREAFQNHTPERPAFPPQF